MISYVLEAVIVVGLVIGACEISKWEEKEKGDKKDGNSK